MSEHPRLRVAVSLYALTFGGLGLAKLGFGRHAMRQGLVERDSVEAWNSSRRVWATTLAATAVVVVAVAGVPYAYAGFALIPVVASVLDRPRPAAKPVLERQGA